MKARAIMNSLLNSRRLALLTLLAVALAFCLPACSVSDKGQTRTLLRTTSQFGTLEVQETRGMRYLFVDGVLQTAMYADHSRVATETHLFPRHYWLELLPYYRPGARRCLLIGLGGGLLPAVLEGYGIETHAVDIDPQIVEVAREYFEFKGEASISDGRAHLVVLAERYDLIVIDAFAGADMPYHLATRECFELATERLEPGGILALNLISRPSGSRVSASVMRTLRAVFPHATAYRSGLSEGVQPIVFFASESPLSFSLHAHAQRLGITWEDLKGVGQFAVSVPAHEGIVLTDGPNPLDQEWMHEALEWQQYMAKMFDGR